MFATPSVGWLGRTELPSRPPRLFTTRDGGRMWHKQTLPLPESWRGAEESPDVPTLFGRLGVLPVTVLQPHRSALLFFTTHDGGRTWRASAARRLAPARGAFVPLIPAAIGSPTTWWSVAGSTRPQIVATFDAGRHWRTSRLPAAAGTRRIAITAAGRTAWVTVDAAVYAGDDGRSWRPISPR